MSTTTTITVNLGIIDLPEPVEVQSTWRKQPVWVDRVKVEWSNGKISLSGIPWSVVLLGARKRKDGTFYDERLEERVWNKEETQRWLDRIGVTEADVFAVMHKAMGDSL